MTSLLHAPAPVQSDCRVLAFDDRPDTSELPEEPFIPSPEDLAWDHGFTVGREGGRFSPPWTWTGEQRLRFVMGRLEGERARQELAARELGEAIGHEEGPSEPPAGLARHEAAAFRKGYQEGLARFEAEREYDAWLDGRASEADPSGRITDADVYPPGCMS